MDILQRTGDVGFVRKAAVQLANRLRKRTSIVMAMKARDARVAVFVNRVLLWLVRIAEHLPKRYPVVYVHALAAWPAIVAANLMAWGGVLAAKAAVAGGALLLHNGYLHPGRGIGKLATERFTATEPYTATERIIASAIDGDSLRAAGKEIRLSGLDAPELLQTCLDQHGGTWACGRQAHAFLRGLVSRGALTCTSSSTDR